MSNRRYRLPDGTVPVLITADIPEMLPREAAALRSYLLGHPALDVQAIAGMLFRTRIARRHRVLAMVTDREELLGALQAVIDHTEHPALARTDGPAGARRVGYVFPGQGSQRPGMGKLFYESIPAFAAEADRCAEAFTTRTGQSPLNYLLDEDAGAEDTGATVQPALFTQMAALAALWRSFGIAPQVAVGHSQGEIAAAYVSGAITLADAVRVVAIRARAADEFVSGDWAMAVIAADRGTCEDALARTSGWAQLSVVNSPNMVGISGERQTVQAIVDAFAERDIFARVIRVRFPAHTSLIHELSDTVLAATRDELQNPKFLDTEIDCLGATLGGPITQDISADQYWFWNLRNTVRFDKAVAAAVQLGVDTFVELAEHPTLQLAIQDNLGLILNQDEQHATLVAGTSNRTATDLGEFTRNLAQLAVHDIDYPWDCLSTEPDGPAALPLQDFPHTLMNETRLWVPFVYADSARPQSSLILNVAAPPATPAAPTVPARLLAEEWIRLSRRSLVPPRAIGIVDHTGSCAALADALCAAAGDVGATARVLGGENDARRTDLDTLVIMLPQSPKLDDAGAAAQVAAFFGERGWWPGVDDTLSDCWLVTAGGEAVLADDAPPDLVHAAAGAGFRSVGAEYLGIRFRHLDLPAAAGTDAAPTILAALHTADESELALRNGALYAKRIVDADSHPADPASDDGTAAEHVLIIGGTGNLGVAFCGHFANRGARRITLVSRSGETPAVTDRLAPIRSATTTQIHVAQCDVGDEAAVARLAAVQGTAPADLIIHAAVQYSGTELEDITVDIVQDALRAKVVGIWRVLNTFPRAANCRVLLCSSISASVGGRGVIVYAAGNRMLDAMAHRLRSEGLDCAAVQWGLWNVYPDLNESAISKLAGPGVVAMETRDALEVGMTTPLRGNAIVATFDLDRARSVLQTCGRASLLSQLGPAQPRAARPAPTSAVAPVAAAPAAEMGVAQRFMSLLATAVGVDSTDQIDTTIPLVAIGLDSLQALELRRRVKLEFDHELEVADLLGGASISDLLVKLET